jgi:hypothetical protein
MGISLIIFGSIVIGFVLQSRQLLSLLAVSDEQKDFEYPVFFDEHFLFPTFSFVSDLQNDFNG